MQIPKKLKTNYVLSLTLVFIPSEAPGSVHILMNRLWMSGSQALIHEGQGYTQLLWDHRIVPEDADYKIIARSYFQFLALTWHFQVPSFPLEKNNKG